MKFIPYGRQYIDNKDIDAVKKTLKNDLITTGAEVQKFEKLFSKKVGVKYSVTCSNATNICISKPKHGILSKSSQPLSILYYSKNDYDMIIKKQRG